MASSNRRRRLFIEPRIQGPLLLRVAAYWMAGMWAAAVMLIGAPYAIGLALSSDHPPTLLEIASRVSGQLWPAFFIALAMMPFALLDILRQSHRIVGPTLRVRRALRELADGKTIEPLHFRKGDYWAETAEAINRVQESLLAASAPPRVPPVLAPPITLPPAPADLGRTLVLPVPRKGESVAETCIFAGEPVTEDRETVVLSELRSLQLFSEGERELASRSPNVETGEGDPLLENFDASDEDGRDTVEFGEATRAAD